VNAKIDMEKGEGIELAKQYDVRCYPNLLFVDGEWEFGASNCWFNVR
jgi:thioredoxin-related protein